jgi:signal transduction histidine kinase
VIQRIQAAQQVEALQTEAAQFHGLATAAVTTGTLVHQIANLANELDYGVRAVHDGLRFSSPDWSEQQRPLLERQTDLLTDVERAGDVLRALLGPLLNVTKLDTRRPCRLVMSIDMPLHVATFAVANLVANAKDAIGHHGKIRIVAREEPPFLVCDVSDNGPGIPVDIRPRLFELGVTTKADSGGWGLYLARKSLSENRGALDLARAEPGDVCFSIRFPAHRGDA